MAKTRSSSKDGDSSASKSKSSKANSKTQIQSKSEPSSSSSVSLFTVFFVSGVTNAIIWFLISSTNLAHVENWNTYKGSIDNSIQSTLNSIKKDIDNNLATKSSVSSVAKVSAMNTKTVQEVKSKFGGFDLADFNKRINSLNHEIKQGAEDMKFYVKENFGNDVKQAKFDIKQLNEELEEKFKSLRVEDLNRNLEEASSKRDEVFVLLEDVKKSQSEIVQKMQGVGSNNDKLESTLGKKLTNLEDEMYKLQGEYVKLQELAGQAENFNIWHETVGKELENTSDSLIKGEQELLEKFTNMLSEMTVLKPIGMDLEAMRAHHKKIFASHMDLIKKLTTELALEKQNRQIQENKIANLKEAIIGLEKHVGIQGGSFVMESEEKSEDESQGSEDAQKESPQSETSDSVKDEL